MSSELFMLPAAVQKRQCLDVALSRVISPLNLTAPQGSGKLGPVHSWCWKERLREAEAVV